MFKYLIIFVFLLFGTYSLADIFDYPAETQTVVESLPQFNSISCKFTQEKVFPQRTLQSGGNFHFIKEKLGMVKLKFDKLVNKQLGENIAIRNKKYKEFQQEFRLSKPMGSYKELTSYAKENYKKDKSDLISLIVMEKSYKDIIIGYTQALVDYCKCWTALLRVLDVESLALTEAL